MKTTKPPNLVLHRHLALPFMMLGTLPTLPSFGAAGPVANHEDKPPLKSVLAVVDGTLARVEIAFGGTLAANPVRYGAALGFGHGDVFDRRKVMSAIEKLNALLSSEGARADVVPVTEMDAEKRTIDLTFEPSKDP